MPVLVAAFAISICGGTIYNITALSLMQTLTPERLLGRLNASRRFVVWGTIPLGSLVGGILASSIGLRATLWVGAIGGSLCFLPVAALSAPPPRCDADGAGVRTAASRRSAPLRSDLDA